LRLCRLSAGAGAGHEREETIAHKRMVHRAEPIHGLARRDVIRDESNQES
jgi:hypothetical protein